MAFAKLFFSVLAAGSLGCGEWAMRYTDIAIIGGGLAGSMAAARLGRAGIQSVLIDPHPCFPPDFRVEKISGDSQLELFRRTGLAESVLPRMTFAGENWIARFGRLLDKSPTLQFGFRYHDFVNAIRDQIPPNVDRIYAKAREIASGPDRQKITLSNDEVVSARLVVLANGLNVGLRHQLGIERETISSCHSISVGFDLVPVGRGAFRFPALTYFSERPSDRIPYISLFPIKKLMRANLFVYRSSDDPWLRELRRAPVATLTSALPRLTRTTGPFEIIDEVIIRPVDLYVHRRLQQPGAVLVGDAYATSCPAAGTGTDKVFTDVERLCNEYIPRWLATDGMATEKIAAFYDDPVKKACDTRSVVKAFEFREVSMATSAYWTAQRWLRFAAWFAQGQIRHAGRQFDLELNILGHSSSSFSSSSSSSLSSSST